MFYGCSRHQKCSPTAWLAEALLQVEFVEGLAQTQADHSKQTGTPEKLRKWFHTSKTGQRRTFNKCSFTCKSMSQLVLTHNLPCKEHYRARPRKASLLSRGFEGEAATRPGRLCEAPWRRCFRRITRKASKCPPRWLIFPYRLPGDQPPNQTGDARDFKGCFWTAMT